MGLILEMLCLSAGLLFAPCQVFAVARRDPFDLVHTRLLWGLAVRCERAIRDISPHCHSRGMVLRQAPHFLESIMMLSSNAMLELVEEDPQPPPVEAALGRLLVSSAASALKAWRQMPGMQPTVRGSSLKLIGRLLKRWSVRGWAPALSALLIPRVAAAMDLCSSGPAALPEVAWALSVVTRERLVHDLQGDHYLRVLSSCHVSALVHQVVAHVLRPARQGLREVARTAVEVLSSHALAIAESVVYTATSAGGYDGTPAAATAAASSSGPLPPLPAAPHLERLVPPLLHLIHSPLLDLLAVMQHVPVETSAEVRPWHCLSTSTIPTSAYMLPLSLDPGAAGARVAMQVGGLIGGWWMGEYMGGCRDERRTNWGLLMGDDPYSWGLHL